MQFDKSVNALYVYFVIFLNFFNAGYMFSEQVPSNLTLRIGIDSFPVSLNPFYATNETSQAIINKVFDSLFIFDPKGEIQNCLVEKIDIKENPGFINNKGQSSNIVNTIEIRMDLKKGIYFSDGKELRTEDVIETFRLIKDERFKYPYISSLHFIEKIERINKFSFKISLRYPSATWKKNLTFKILNSKELNRVTPDSFRKMNLSGTGPYKLIERFSEGKIFLERNPFLGKIQEREFQFLQYIVVSDTHLSPLKLINQEVDICALQPESVNSYMKSSSSLWRNSFHVLKYKKFGYTYLVFNTKNTIITTNVKKLFYNLLIKGDFLTRFLKKRGETVCSPFIPLCELVEPVSLSYSVPKSPIHLRILCNSESKIRKEFVLFLRALLKSYNIILHPVFLEYQSFLDHLKTGQFDMAISGYVINIDYDISDCLDSNGYFNYAHFQNSGMDNLLVSGISEMNPEKRKNIYLKAHRLWEEHLPVIPLFNLYYYVGVSSKVLIPSQTYEVVGASGDFLCNIVDWKRRNLLP